MRLQLIQGWRNAWRLTSVQAAALLSLLGWLTVLHQQVLPLFAFAIPASWYPWIAGVWGTVIIVLRMLAQPGVLTDGDAAQPPASAPETSPDTTQGGFVIEGMLLNLGLLACGLLLGFLLGVTHASQRCTKAANAAQVKAAQTAASASVATAAVAASAAQTQADIRTVYKDRVIKQYVEVPREVVAKEDADCRIPGRFVSLWNTANRAELPSFAAQLDAAPSRVALSDVGAQHEREAELCTRNTEQLKALQAAERERQRVMEAAR